MRPLNRRLALIACALVIVLGNSACTSGTTDAGSTSTDAGALSGSVIDTSGVSSSAAESPTQTVTSSASLPTPSVIDVPTQTPAVTSASLDPQAQEAADRAAVEAQYAKFWETYENIVRTAPAERSTMLDAVSVDPLKSKILDAASSFDAQGLDYYGSVTEHPYWVDAISGGHLAVMRDCQDQSNYGSVFVASGEKRTVGVEKISLQVGFARGSDGIWRVQNLQHLNNVPC